MEIPAEHLAALEKAARGYRSPVQDGDADALAKAMAVLDRIGTAIKKR